MRVLSKVLVVVVALAFLACAKDKAGGAGAEEAAKTPEGGEGAAKTTSAEGNPAAVKTEGAKPAATSPAAAPAEGTTANPDEPVARPAASEEKIPDVVARVNGVDIKADEYRTELDKITSRGAKIPPERMERIKQNILKRIIEKQLIDQEIAKQQIEVTPAEIDAAVEEYKKRFRTDEQFQNYLRHGKVTIDQIRERMRAKAALEKLIEKTGNLKVDDAEALEFYGKNERFYVEKAGVRASHILVKVDEGAPQDKVDAAQAKIKEAQAALAKGEDFGEVAKKFSEGPSAPKGGDLGFFGKGQMVKPFEDVAFALETGKLSDPVRTRFGFHVIKVFEKREERKKPFDEVKSQILESLRNKKFFKERRSLIQRLNQSAEIEKFL